MPFLRPFRLLAVLFLSLQQLAAQSYSDIEKAINILDKNGKPTGKTATLQERMQSLKIPGVSINLFDDGKIKWAKGFGIGDNNTNQQIDTNSIFQAASLSKPVTSLALFSLAEQGKIELDEDINSQLTSWKIPDNKYTRTQMPTPRNIASHMGGLSLHGFRGYKQGDKLPTLSDILEGTGAANSKPVRVIEPAGKKLTYSGGGYMILQLLLEEKTALPFAELMQQQVLGPNGMSRSSFAIRLPDSLSSLIAKGHHANGNMIDGGYHLFPEQAAAGLWTSPSDLARLMINVGNAWRNDTGFPGHSTVRSMFINIPAGNGSGFGIEGENKTLRFSHLGSNPGYYCYAVSFLETGRGIVIMTNSDNGLQLIKEIVKTVYQNYQWLP